MATITKIKKDHEGLYAICGGWIARPLFGTSFNEGDEVKTHHFGGSSFAGVTTRGNNFKREGMYEIWSTTGIMASEYKSKTQDEITKNTEWYRDHYGTSLIEVYSKRNREFVK